ncbi:DNA polymerase III subunit delta' [Azospirillum sp. B4]|uniref:DNA polymerase III subunit delta' n=1 Tax=Azospirillum sp. B4 TaxID=95605 RepID=UPI00034CAD2D|nr:DNA polymerase III subunit delta' [Azospirillum sp. B4]
MPAPAFDRESVPAPIATHDLMGHAAAEQTLLKAATGGRLHHAWLIGGPPGIGKATLAYRFARFLLSGGAEQQGDGLFGAPPPPTSLYVSPENPIARRVAAGAHGDLLTIQRTWDEKRKRFKRDLPVEEVRRIAPFLRLTAAEGGWRIVVVDGADQMNPSGQNAILKILEEPPPRALILLVADNPGALLPTIRSRTRTLMLDPLPTTTVRSLVNRIMPELEMGDAAALTTLADGSIGRGLDLAAAGGLDLYRVLLGVLDTLPRLDLAAAHALADQVARAGQDTVWETTTDLLLWWLARFNRSLARGIPAAEIVEGEAALMERLSFAARRDRALDRWMEVWDNVNRLFAKAEGANLDRKQVMLSALRTIEAAAS